MIRRLRQVADNFLGRGEAAVTVPPLDGALRPNRILDEAARRLTLADVDDLAVVEDILVASAGNSVWSSANDDVWRLWTESDAPIRAIAALEDGLALALSNGEIVVEGGTFDQRRYTLPGGLTCITALATDGRSLYIANGSTRNAPEHWARDLLEKGATGSIWILNLENGDTKCLARDLAYPAGLLVTPFGLVFSEAWKHRLVRLDTGGNHATYVLHSDLPGYPGRISPAKEGSWLSVFAPRSQLVEFVLREPVYRSRMLAEVPEEFWIAPKLRSGRSFYEPLQGGSVKHLGLLKPWAPTMSAGLAVKLDDAFQPVFSLHSRADGVAHGITATVEHAGQVHAAARGDGVVVSVDLTEAGGYA